jgi:hypothetical protein
MAQTRATRNHIVGTAALQTDGTTHYYMKGIGWPFLVLQFNNTAGVAGTNTLTVWASAVDDGTAPAAIAASDWVNVTNAWFGAATFTATAFMARTTAIQVSNIRIRVIRSADGANNDGAWTIRAVQHSS